MNKKEIIDILNDIKDMKISPEEALVKIKLQPFEDLGYAKIDTQRGVRQGIEEVIFGRNKTKEQIFGIVEHMVSAGRENILITKLSREIAKSLSEKYELFYDPLSLIGVVNRVEEVEKQGSIIVVSGGTSDAYVCEEAALTAEVLGNKVTRIYDVGVAGIHRLLSYLDELCSARVIIAVAGMEGALASVVGGLVDCPVIAVPTSVGYGASFEGLAALLSMLNSCASGISVVNIDNGFGAGYLASMINQMKGNSKN